MFWTTPLVLALLIYVAYVLHEIKGLLTRSVVWGMFYQQFKTEAEQKSPAGIAFLRSCGRHDAALQIERLLK